MVLESEELTLAHERTYVNEYVNHLQAVNFDIRAKYDATEGNDDARMALRAILEGDSAIGEYIYATEHFTPGGAGRTPYSNRTKRSERP